MLIFQGVNKQPVFADWPVSQQKRGLKAAKWAGSP